MGFFGENYCFKNIVIGVVMNIDELVFIRILNSIGSVKLVIVGLFVSFMGRMVRKVVSDVNSVCCNVWVRFRLIIFFSGCFGFSVWFFFMWLNIIILLFIE